MKTLLNVDTITGPEDFRAFAAEVLETLEHDNDGGGEKRGDLDQFELPLAALCYAFHVDLLRGEALECYDPDLFWTDETAEAWAGRTDEDGDDPECLCRSSAGEGVKSLLDHIFETWL